MQKEEEVIAQNLYWAGKYDDMTDMLPLGTNIIPTWQAIQNRLETLAY